VGITSAMMPEKAITAYHRWINNNYCADMDYMENQARCDLQSFLPGAKTAIIFITAYKQQRLPFRSDTGLVASFARGRDYHNVHRKRLKKFISWLGDKSNAKGFSDSSPVMEKILATQAGLGTIGKNTLLIHPRFGSFILLSGVLTTLEIPHPPPSPMRSTCGDCHLCIDACPVSALVSPHCLDARRCLSYHLIESKKPIPKEIQDKNPGYIFGCDICQNVCPYNAQTPLSTSPDFSPDNGLGAYLSDDDIEYLSNHPKKLYGTPLKRRYR